MSIAAVVQTATEIINPFCEICGVNFLDQVSYNYFISYPITNPQHGHL